MSYKAFTKHFDDQVTHKWKECEWERSKWMTSVIEVKNKWLWSVPNEMQVPAKCLASARRRLAADLRVIFTQNYCIGNTCTLYLFWQLPAIWKLRFQYYRYILNILCLIPTRNMWNRNPSYWDCGPNHNAKADALTFNLLHMKWHSFNLIIKFMLIICTTDDN